MVCWSSGVGVPVSGATLAGFARLALLIIAFASAFLPLVTCPVAPPLRLRSSLLIVFSSCFTVLFPTFFLSSAWRKTFFASPLIPGVCGGGGSIFTCVLHEAAVPVGQAGRFPGVCSVN